MNASVTAADPSDANGTESSRRLIESGHRFEDAGDFRAALAEYQAAVAVAPSHIRAYLNLGNALQRLGRTPDAVMALNTALRIDPGSAPCHFNLGHAYMAAQDPDAAEREFREALLLDPGMASAAIALANLLDAGKRPDEAEKALREALARAPDCAPAAYNLGVMLQRRGEFDQAEDMFRAGLDADPSFVMACTALGDVIRNRGDSQEAEAWYRRALAADPRSQPAWSSLLLSLNNRDDLSAEDIFSEHLRLGAAFPEDAAARTLRKRHQGRSRLRVGYLSGDFIQHPVALFLRPLLENHDRAQFESFCYSNNATEDWMTQEIRSRAEHWRNIAGQDDCAAAQTIRADELDVLIDLSGHSARSRVLLFNHGCATVHATWVGYLNTTGLPSVDFRITDRYADPPRMTEHLHVEKLLRLPDSQWCYAPVYDIPEAPMPAQGAPGNMVFGSFNHLSKVGAPCVELWSRVLDALPASELRILNAPLGRASDLLRHRFEQRGINRDRVSFVPALNIDKYLAAIGEVDIALDSHPYNGGTTTFDTLWMGVPLVALAGERSVSRSGVSILSCLQMPELIAGTDDEYVAINLRLAADREWRRKLRGTLRARMRASPLMDAARFARGFEEGIRQMLGK
jgi:protein O-GlcNAc transferase